MCIRDRFNINEPVIYGYPIVYNLPLMIPFVLLPDLFIGITYGPVSYTHLNRHV